MLFLQNFFFSMISLYKNFIKGNQSVKRFHILIFLFSQIKQRRNSNRLHICTIFGKKSFSRNSIFSLLFFEHESNFHMTMVSDNPHVALLLRINISKLGCALQVFFISRYSPHVALLLRINISKLGCALQAFFISRYSPHVALLLRINISNLICDFQS